jgi:hypothetical protein
MKKILTHKKQIKIHFLIKKQVEYGSGVYVSGSCNELGAWNIEHALRLNWNPVIFFIIRIIIGQDLFG